MVIRELYFVDFKLSGIGVDDMFVIMGSLNGLDSLQRQMDIPSQMGLVLKRAGISITVTSVTDFIAFFIGATTVSLVYIKDF